MPKTGTPVNYLDLIPQTLFGHEVQKDGRIWILVPRFTSKFFSNYLLPVMKNKYIPLKLDELGSATYLQIDGQRNVLTICEKLSEKLGQRIHPAEERVTSFLSHLYKGKIIKLQHPNKENLS